MTKMLMVGMPLAEVIRASTSTPAKAIGYADKIGTLKVGLEADVVVLEIRRTDFGMFGHITLLVLLCMLPGTMSSFASKLIGMKICFAQNQ